mmetsp:Transcript_1640/g.3637  ORF Transcript_1640/g.3637 Transcript_1640/m.3637 type:complete len:193 (-) Transcript_1640:30-608(-)
MAGVRAPPSRHAACVPVRAAPLDLRHPTQVARAVPRRPLALLVLALGALVASMPQAFLQAGQVLQGSRRTAHRSVATMCRAAAGAPVPQEVQPLGSQVLIEELEVPTETKGGLLLTEGAKKKRAALRTGVVRAKGGGESENKRDMPLLEALNVGDTVLWEDYAPPFSEDPDNKLFLIKVQNIKGKVVSAGAS